MAEVIPGIGTLTDWGEIEKRLNLVIGVAEWAQIDFADNTIVPNTTFLDVPKYAPFAQKISLEAHLMVASPEKYIKSLADAGFKRIIAHVEAHEPRLFFEKVKYEQVETGIAIDGPTDFDAIEPFLEEADSVLVMMYEAGFSGQKFQPEQLEKIKSIHSYLPDLPIEVDGGITDQTARLVREAGATRLVSTSYLFNNPANIAAAIEQLKSV